MSMVSRVPVAKPTPARPDRWYVEVCVEEPNGIRTYFALGPRNSWSDARSLATTWEREFGENTTRIACRQFDDGRYKKPSLPDRLGV